MAGRKPKDDPASYFVGFKITAHERAQMERMMAEMGITDRSRFIKSALFGREIKVVKIDKAAMDYYIKLTEFHRQFQAIGNNYNQITRAVKTNFGEKRGLAMLYRLEKATVELVVLSRRITELTKEFEEQWLQK